MALTDPFTRHPASVGETYGEHMVSAGSFAVRLAAAAVVCGIHAVLPFLFEKTASRLVTDLYGREVRIHPTMREQHRASNWAGGGDTTHPHRRRREMAPTAIRSPSEPMVPDDPRVLAAVSGLVQLGLSEEARALAMGVAVADKR